MEENMLKVTKNEMYDIPVIVADGDIDIYSVASFKTAINEVLDTGANKLVIDLKDVEYIDSSGFGALLGATRRIRPNGGSIILTGCCDTVARIMKITQLDTIFVMCKDCQEAVDSIKND